MNLLVVLGTAVLVLLPLSAPAAGRYIVPLDDPYVWSNQLNWGTQNCHTLLSFTEDGNVTGSLRVGSFSEADFTEDMPILAASFATNIREEFVYAKYAFGLNLYLINGVVTGDTNGEFKYLIKNWMPYFDGNAAFGILLQGHALNIEKIGVSLSVLGAELNAYFNNTLTLNEVRLSL